MRYLLVQKLDAERCFFRVRFECINDDIVIAEHVLQVNRQFEKRADMLRKRIDVHLSGAYLPRAFHECLAYVYLAVVHDDEKIIPIIESENTL